MAEDTSGGVGRLLGVNQLQRAVDSLERVVEKMGASYRTDVSARPAAQWANRAWYGNASPYSPSYRPQSGGLPIGGNVTFNRYDRSTGGTTAYTAPGVPPTYTRYPSGGGGYGPGGGGTPPTWPPPRGYPSAGSYPPAGSNAYTYGTGLRGMWQGMVSMGNRMMPDQLAMDSYATWATIGSNSVGARNAARYGAFGANNRANNGMALSATDAMQGAMIAQRTFGTTNITAGNGGTMNSAMAALSTTDPTLGAGGSANLMRQLYSTQGYYRMMSLGLGRTMIGGRAQPLNQIGNALLQRTFGSRQLTPDQMRQAVSDNGMLGYNISQLGLDSRSSEALKNYLQGLSTAQGHGMSGADYDALSQKAMHGDKGAWSKLSKVGIRRSSLQSLKDLQATRTGRSGDVNEDFSNSVSDATDSVDAFSKALTSIVNLPIIKQIVGASGGASIINGAVGGFLNSPFGKFAGPLASMFGIGGGPLGSGGGAGMLGGKTMSGMGGGAMNSVAASTSGVNGNAVSDAKNNGTTVAAPTGGGKTAAQALSIAEKYEGWRYIWGGAKPSDGGFDCSGLWDYVLRQMHFPGLPAGRMVVPDFKRIPGQKVRPSEVKPGDFVFHGREHIEMYTGNNKTYGAHNSRLPIGFRPYYKGYYDSAYRIFGGIGNMNDLSNNNNSGDQSTLNHSGGGGDLGDYGSVEEASAIMNALANGASGGMSMSGGGQSSSGNGGSAGPTPSGASGTTPSGAKKLGQQMAAAYGWGSGTEWSDLLALWMQESGWNYKAKNKSGAYGIPQSLPGHKMSSAGSDWMTNPATQIKWGLGYIKGRYGDPVHAWAHEKSIGWYDKGAWEITQDQNARIHQGEMVIPAKQASLIRDVLVKDALYATTTSDRSKGGGGGAVSLNFRPGSVVIQVQGAMTQDAARNAASAFADQLAKEDIYNRIAAGVTNNVS